MDTNIIAGPKEQGLSPLRRRRFLRHYRQFSQYMSRGQFQQAERCILEYQRTRHKAETELDRWDALLDSLLTGDPVYLHPNEPEFLCDMRVRLDRCELPTTKQGHWLRQIARRRP